MENLKSRCYRLRKDVIEIIMAGKSGHIGGDMSEMEILTDLYFRQLRVSPEDPDNPDRDYFIMSKGHSVEAEPGVGLFMRLKGGWRVYLSDGSESLHLEDTVKYFCILDERLSHSVDLRSWVEHIQNSIPCDEQDAVQEGKVRFVPIPCEKPINTAGIPPI